MFATLGQPYGWAEGVAEGLSNGLVSLGHEVEIATTGEQLTESSQLGGVRVHSFPVDSWTRRGPRVIRSAYLSSGLAHYLRRSAAAFDLIHVHTLYSFASVTAAREARRAHVPYVISPCGSLDPFTHRRKGRIRKEIFQALYHRRDFSHAAAVHFLSRGELELASEFGIAAPHVVVQLGLSVANYSSQGTGVFRRQHSELANSRLIMYLGRISYTKGLDLLVDAFSRTARRFEDAHLLLVGPDYERYGRLLSEMLRSRGLSNRATFTGLLSEAEKNAALADSDILVLPSYTEAFGIALLEGMASGLPVVVTDRAALAPHIRDAGAGLVVSPDARSLAQALSALLLDAELRREFGRRGRCLVETQFSWAESARGFSKLYEAVANKNGVESALATQ